MSWFDRNRGELPIEEAWTRLGDVVEASGVGPALHAAAGPQGLRRFVVRFEVRAGKPRVTGLDAEPLPKGGGPPTAATFDAHVGAVEKALSRIHRGFPAPFVFDRGAIGFVRGDTDELDLSFRFDEDADALRLADLPMPTGQPSPVEDPRYVRALSAWEGRIGPVRARWLVPGRGEAWVLEDGRLTLAGPGGERVLPAEPIARYWPRGNRFEWLVATPVGEEPPFVEPVLTVAMNAAMELAVFAAARLKRVGVFQGEIEGGRGEILFAALRD